jgi:protein SCO1/2
MNPRTARLLLVFGSFLAGLVLCLGVILIVTGRTPAPIMPAAAAIGGPFHLTDQNGKPVSHADMQGKPFLVFFGFTHCPDVCPTTLFEVSEVFRRLGGDADKARALFITVDPDRDSPDKLKDYMQSFDPRIIGLTGDADGIAGALKAYRVYARKIPLKDGDYTMDHTAIVYLMDKDGRFVAPFNLKRGADAAAAELRRHL